jgi:hypothetical protein
MLVTHAFRTHQQKAKRTDWRFWFVATLIERHRLNAFDLVATAAKAPVHLLSFAVTRGDQPNACSLLVGGQYSTDAKKLFQRIRFSLSCSEALLPVMPVRFSRSDKAHA